MTLDELRIKKNKTLKQTAEMIGISESYCSLLMRGKRRLSLDNAEKLSKIFGKTIDEIFLLYNFAKCKEIA